MSVIEYEIKDTKKQRDFYRDLCEVKDIKINQLQQDNIQLKERIAYLERSNERKEETIIDYQINEYSILEELKKWLEDEKYILAKSVSHIYEDSLGHSKFVNEDIYNELIKVSNKIKELEEGKK